MQLKFSFFIFLASLPLIISSCCEHESCPAKAGKSTSSSQQSAGPGAPVEQSVRQSLVRINSTIQAWSASQPWDKSAPAKRRALGALLDGNRVLTTAEMAANATYIEMENADSTRRIPAKVTAIDYEANLALLEPNDGDTESFFKDLHPLTLGSPALIGDRVDVWQLEDNGMPIVTDATIQSVDILSSFAAGHFFLAYEA